MSQVQQALYLCWTLLAVYFTLACVLVVVAVYYSSSILNLVRRVWRVQKKYDDTQKQLRSKIGMYSDDIDINGVWNMQMSMQTKTGILYTPSTFDDGRTADAAEESDVAALKDSFARFVKDYGQCYGDTKDVASLREDADNYQDEDVSDQDAEIGSCVRYVTQGST